MPPCPSSGAAVSCGEPEATPYVDPGTLGPGPSVNPDGTTVASAGKSCTGAPGADKKCGGSPDNDKADGSQDCCAVAKVPGGRFNRFNFSLGIGYDFPRGVTDDYLHFPYPYLFAVPGYDVRAVPLAPADR